MGKVPIFVHIMYALCLTVSSSIISDDNFYKNPNGNNNYHIGTLNKDLRRISSGQNGNIPEFQICPVYRQITRNGHRVVPSNRIQEFCGHDNISDKNTLTAYCITRDVCKTSYRSDDVFIMRKLDGDYDLKSEIVGTGCTDCILRINLSILGSYNEPLK